MSSKTEINKICTRNLLTLHIYNFYDYFVQMVEGCGRILRTFRRMAKIYFRMEFVRVLKSFKKKCSRVKYLFEKRTFRQNFDKHIKKNKKIIFCKSWSHFMEKSIFSLYSPISAVELNASKTISTIHNSNFWKRDT